MNILTKANNSNAQHHTKQIHPRLVKHTKQDYESKLLEVLCSNGLTFDEAKKYRKRVDQSYVEQDTTYFAPHTITVNPTSACNFKCIMCDVPRNNRPKIQLDIDLICNALLKLKSQGMQCCILGSGAEITLYKPWRELITFASKLFPDVILMTNGSLLTDEDVKFLAYSNVSRLCVSLDASTPEMHASIRGHKLLPKIESSIHKLLEFRNSAGKPGPLVRVSFVLMDCNLHQRDEFISKWSGVVDSVEIQSYVDISGFRNKEYVSKLKSVQNIQNPTCHYPWNYLSIWADGSISSCCTSYGRDAKELHYANIHDEDWLNLIEEKSKELQASFLKSSIPSSCNHCLEVKSSSNAL